MEQAFIYPEQYPHLAAIDNTTKMVIGFILLICEWYFILKKYQFNFCKITYGVKLIQILFTTFESFTNRILR